MLERHHCYSSRSMTLGLVSHSPRMLLLWKQERILLLDVSWSAVNGFVHDVVKSHAGPATERTQSQRKQLQSNQTGETNEWLSLFNTNNAVRSRNGWSLSEVVLCVGLCMWILVLRSAIMVRGLWAVSAHFEILECKNFDCGCIGQSMYSESRHCRLFHNS